MLASRLNCCESASTAKFKQKLFANLRRATVTAMHQYFATPLINRPFYEILNWLRQIFNLHLNCRWSNVHGIEPPACIYSIFRLEFDSYSMRSICFRNSQMISECFIMLSNGAWTKCWVHLAVVHFALREIDALPMHFINVFAALKRVPHAHASSW